MGQHCGITDEATTCSAEILPPAVVAAPLLNQLPSNLPGKVAKDGQGPWTPELT